jgi:hypothetical protein
MTKRATKPPAKRTTTKAQPPAAKRKPAASKARQPRSITASQANIAKALRELGITKPYYSCKVVGGRLRFTLYGGDVVFWPPKEE